METVVNQPINPAIYELTADFLALFILLLNMFLGWKLGLTRRLFTLIGSYIAAFIAGVAASGVGAVFPIAPTIAQDVLGAFLCFIGIILLVELLGWLYHDRLARLASFAREDWLGLVGGIVAGLFQLGFLALIITSANFWGSPAAGSAETSGIPSLVSVGGSIAVHLLSPISSLVRELVMPLHILNSKGYLTF